MVKPGFLEHCLFVWLLLCCSTAEKYIPLLLLAGAAAGFEVPRAPGTAGWIYWQRRLGSLSFPSAGDRRGLGTPLLRSRPCRALPPVLPCRGLREGGEEHAASPSRAGFEWFGSAKAKPAQRGGEGEEGRRLVEVPPRSQGGRFGWRLPHQWAVLALPPILSLSLG